MKALNAKEMMKLFGGGGSGSGLPNQPPPFP